MLVAKPCPFCGSDRMDLRATNQDVDKSAGEIAQFYMLCTDCGARGPKIVATVDDGLGYPVVGEKGEFLGYMTRRCVGREPELGQPFLLAPPPDLTQDYAEGFSMNQTTVVVTCVWETGTVNTNGEHFEFWTLKVLSGQDGLWQMGGGFLPWPFVHGKLV